MSEVKYTVIDQELSSIPEVENYSGDDISLIDNFIINKSFNFDTNYIESHFYSMNQIRLLSLYDYELPTKEILNKNTSTLDEDGDEDGNDNLISQITVDPSTLASDYGYGTTEVRILFHFLNDVFTFDNSKTQFFINSISKDRTEVALYSKSISFSRLRSSVGKLKDRLNNESYFDELWLNFGNNDLFIVTNLDTYKVDDVNVVTVKLYEPLPAEYTVKNTLQVVEKVSDSIAVKVTPEIIEPEPQAPKLDGPNFSVETNEDSSDPTQFFNFTQLFDFPLDSGGVTSNSPREIFSFIKEKGIEPGIDYTSFENFIHFSSAEERLNNFIYKKGQLELLEADLADEESVSNTTTTSVSSSISSTKNKIKNIIDNFDHYERHLYYDSGSTSWPKSPTDLNGNDVRPYVNRSTTHADAITFTNTQLTASRNYDAQNYDLLTNFLPDYITEETRNAPAILFTHMLGQHYDNLWIYSKAISERYNTDHRIEIGLPKDMVREAIRGMGVKIYNSIEGSNDLFKYLINDSYDSGSAVEVINNFVSAEDNGSGNTKQPISRRDYEAELYKRIYHNIPFLLKNKGTARGLRALINCFGIPSTYLQIRHFGGLNIPSDTGPDFPQKITDGSSLSTNIFHTSNPKDTSKLTGYLSGSDTTGSLTLSQYVSIRENEASTLPKLHLERLSKAPNKSEIEVGFSPAHAQNDKIGQYPLDDFIGDPNNLYSDTYKSFPTSISGSTMEKAAEEILDPSSNSPRTTPTNLKDFVRIFKFYDNVIFKMIKDFLPVSDQVHTGIIIKPHLLNRSKIKSPILTGTQPEYSGSIDTAFVTGSNAGSFNEKDNSKFIDLHHEQLTGTWYGELGGATDIIFSFNNYGRHSFINKFEAGEIGVVGNTYYHPDGTKYILSDPTGSTTPGETYINTPFEGGATHQEFQIMFTSESVGARFGGLDAAGTVNQHLVPIKYDTSNDYWVVRNNTMSTGSGHGDVILTGSITRSNDVIISTIHQSGSQLAAPVHNFYTSLSGNNQYFTGSYKSKNFGEVTALTLDGNTSTGGVIGVYTTENVAAGSGVTYPGSGLTIEVLSVDSNGRAFNIDVKEGGDGYVVGAIKTLAITNGGTGYSVGANKEVVNINSLGQEAIINITSVSGGGVSGPISGVSLNSVASERGFNYKVGDTLRPKNLGDNNAIFTVTAIESSRVRMPNFGSNANNFVLISEVKGLGTKPAIKLGHFNAPTFYEDTYKSLSGSISKLIKDESPKITGEFSGSVLTVTDGELNDDNKFKKNKTQPIKYNINTISQAANDTLTNFTIFNNLTGVPSSSTAAATACGFSTSQTTTKFHTGNNPTATVGDDVFNSINGLNGEEFDGGDKFYKVTFDDDQNDANYAALIDASTGNISDLRNCGEFDNTPPNAFNFAFKVASIIPSNFTAVPFEIHGIDEDLTIHFSASTDGESAVTMISGSQSVTAAATHSLTLDTTQLGDGDITLQVSSSDAASPIPNVTVGTHVSGTGLFGRIIPKNLTAPPTPTVKFIHTSGSIFVTSSVCTTVVSTQKGQSFTSNNITYDIGDPLYQILVENLADFTGSIISTFSGNGSSVTITENHPGTALQPFGVDTHYIVFNKFDGSGAVSKRNESNGSNSNTVTVTTRLERDGVQGATGTDTINYRDYSVDIGGLYSPTSTGDTSFSFNSSGGNLQRSIAVGYTGMPVTMSRVGNTATWFRMGVNGSSLSNEVDFTGATVNFILNASSYSGTTSRVASFLHTVEVDTVIRTGRTYAVNQAGTGTGCVDYDTKILTPEGFIIAGEIKTGDIVRTKEEFANKWMQDIVIRVQEHHTESRFKFIFDDGESLIASYNHRLFYEGDYREMILFNVGDKVSNKTIEKIEEIGEGKVFQITTEKTHTYISNGVLSHNDKGLNGGGGGGIQ